MPFSSVTRSLLFFSHFTRLIDSFYEHIGEISSTSRSRRYYRATKVHDAMRAKWFEITEHGMVVDMLIGMTMDLIGRFRYFQIDLHPSNNFCAISKYWLIFRFLIVNSAFPVWRWSMCFLNRRFKDLIFNLTHHRKYH